jgi:hypothetical protein
MTAFQLRATIISDVARALAQVDPTRALLVPETTRQLLAESSSDRWLPGELVLDLYDRILADTDEEFLTNVARRTAYLAESSPFMRKLREQALRFVGHAPGLIFRWVPGARAMSVRGCGVATYQSIERGCRIVVSGAPMHVVDHRGFQVATRGSFLSVLDMTGCAGDVRVRCDGTTIAYETRWWARRRVDARHGDGDAMPGR